MQKRREKAKKKRLFEALEVICPGFLFYTLHIYKSMIYVFS